MDEFFEKSIKPVGTNIQPQARIVINNVLTFLTELKEDPEKLKTINFNQARDLAAKICGVSLKTVANIRRECTTDGPIIPRENICQPRPVRDMDDFDKNVIKNIVSSFYSKGEYPSVKKILEKAKESIEGLKCSHNSMRNILIDLGYKSKTAPDGRTQIMERDDIIGTTLQFQSKMKKVKMSDKPKRPMSAYMLWLNSAREQIKADNPGLKVTEIAKKGGEIWRAMKDKSEWEEKAAQAKEQYTKDLESYNANGGGGEGGGGKKAQKRGKKGKKASPAKAKKKKEESDDEDGGDDDEEESE